MVFRSLTEGMDTKPASGESLFHVVGANRYRNPDEDLPADFESNRDAYYQALGLPLDAERFITELQIEMREALHTSDAGLKKNRQVRISS